MLVKRTDADIIHLTKVVENEEFSAPSSGLSKKTGERNDRDLLRISLHNRPSSTILAYIISKFNNSTMNFRGFSINVSNK